MTIRFAAAACLALGLAACATDKPLETRCLRLADFQDPPPEAFVGSTRLVHPREDPITKAFAVNPATASTAGTEAVPQESDALILSGGGQWGAYGAGVMRGWSSHGRLPARVVTGISTGALQSTFAYLGPGLDAQLISAYSVTNERQLVKRHGKTFFLSHASMADTKPLKAYVRQRVGPLLDDVKAEYLSTGRVLLVGAVDGLTGKFHYFDMTRMAAELFGEERLDCYTAALIASASVPVVFRQTTINNQPWLDGGVRRSLFLPQMIQRIATSKAADRDQNRQRPTDGRVYAIRNGTLEPEAVDALPAQLLPTITRLKDIVLNQVEQDSLDLSAFYAERAGMKLFYTTADGWNGFDPCRSHQAGVADLFNPGLMNCLIAYGDSKWQAGQTPWIEHVRH